MIDLSNIKTPDLIRVHNECAEKLGVKPVARFADRATAEKRTRFILSQISPSQRPAPFGEQPADSAKSSKTLGAGIADTLNKAFGAGTASAAPAPKATKKPDVTINLENGDIREDGKKVGNLKDGPKQRQQSAAKDAIAAAPMADVPVKPSLPIPSGDAEKDAEMPALRKVVRAVELKPKAKLYPRKEGSKQAILVDMLSRPGGATFGELYDAMKAASGKPWKGVTIRSGLAWDMNTLAGYGITTEFLDGMQMAGQGREYEARRVGVEYTSSGGYKPGPAYDPALKQAVYRLTYPKGVEGPLPHTPRPGPSPAQKAANKAATHKALADASKKD